MSVPLPREYYDLCVIGAGSGGLSVAAGAAQMGAAVALIERAEMGGDCLNSGCVPSKALLAAGHAAAAVRSSGGFGITCGPPAVDGAAVFGHVAGVIAQIAPHDSAARFEGLGATVIRGEARFTGPREVIVAERRLRARRFVIATGSSPRIPPIPGLADVSYLTNETVFRLRAIPRHLIIVGGGPIGAELAQAFAELGAAVSVVEQATLLPREDPELVAVIRARLTALRVGLHEGVAVAQVEAAADGVRVLLDDPAQTLLHGSHLLLAAGRTPTVDGLGLAQAGVACGASGITVDARLRTSNRRIFAVGDVTGGLQFTHVAGYQAGIVLRNALFRLPARADYRCVPRVTYTSPELAQVGLTEAQAEERHPGSQVLRSGFADNDRAQTERSADGLIKVMVDRRGRILGAGIAGPQAGELIQTWVLAMSRRLKIGAVATMIAPYPTLGEISKRAAGAYYAPKLFGAGTRRLVRLLARFG